MAWRRYEPVHQQSRYWLSSPGIFLTSAPRGLSLTNHSRLVSYTVSATWIDKSVHLKMGHIISSHSRTVSISFLCVLLRNFAMIISDDRSWKLPSMVEIWHMYWRFQGERHSKMIILNLPMWQKSYSHTMYHLVHAYDFLCTWVQIHFHGRL